MFLFFIKIVKPKFDYYSYAPKGINIKIVQAFLQNNKNISLIGNYVNKLMERNKIIHPNIETFRFDVAYKAHDFIENPKKIGENQILKSNTKLNISVDF